MVNWKDPQVMAVCLSTSRNVPVDAALSDWIRECCSHLHECLAPGYRSIPIRSCAVPQLRMGRYHWQAEIQNADARAYLFAPLSRPAAHLGRPLAVLLHEVDVGCGFCGNVIRALA